MTGGTSIRVSIVEVEVEGHREEVASSRGKWSQSPRVSSRAAQRRCRPRTRRPGVRSIPSRHVRSFYSEGAAWTNVERGTSGSDLRRARDSVLVDDGVSAVEAEVHGRRHAIVRTGQTREGRQGGRKSLRTIFRPLGRSSAAVPGKVFSCHLFYVGRDHRRRSILKGRIFNSCRGTTVMMLPTSH